MIKSPVSAIICEFNPLHFGHLHLLRQAKKLSDTIICLMSGNFVQRGDSAIIDKWKRTRIALMSGADLVVELPLPFACATAEKFAKGAISILNALGVVDILVFGSENPDIKKLRIIAEAISCKDFSSYLHCALKSKGITFANARSLAVKNMIGADYSEIMALPNNILAIEYIKAIASARSSIEPVAIRRIGAGHDTIGSNSPILSASEIRLKIQSFDNICSLVPAYVLHEIEPHCISDISRLELTILYRLRSMDTGDFSKIADVSEGLENVIYKASRKATSLTELYSLMKSKRYPLARIRRLVLNSFLGVTSDLPAYPAYARILGMSPKGETVLRMCNPSIPIACKSSDFKNLGGDCLRLFNLEAFADDIYCLSLLSPTECGSDYKNGIVKL